MTNAFSWGFDGWIYACHGYSNDSKVQGKRPSPIHMNSGNTYRMRPDGSHAEYFTHGQVNPFGLAFDPLGNLYSCRLPQPADLSAPPRGLLSQLRQARRRPRLRPRDGDPRPRLDRHRRHQLSTRPTSSPRPIAAPIFIGNVVTNRINHDRIEWHGSSPKGIEQPDFVWSEDNWFRPVDIELGPDGALYVADFYNRIIGHYEVPLTHPGRDRERGRIWRIVYKGTDGKPALRLRPIDRTRSSVDGPGRRPRPPQPDGADHGGQPARRPRRRAGRLRGPQGHDAGNTGPPARARPLGAPPPECARRRDARGLRGDQDRELRVHGLKALVERAETRRSRSPTLATGRLTDADPFVRRAAAEVLGAHPAVQHPAAAGAPPVDPGR